MPQVVLGISAHFLRINEHPTGRNAYSTTISVISMLLSLLWLIPSTGAMLHFAGDVILALAWFAAFGVDAQWMQHHNGCSSGAFQWRGAFHGGQCGEWKAMEAFSFVAACLWVASAILSLWVERKVRKQGVSRV